MPSTRRAMLSGVGTALLPVLAGCTGNKTTALDVETVEVRQSFEWLQASTHWQGVTLTDEQLVVLHIPESAGVQSQFDVSVVVGETSIESAETVAGVDRSKIAWGREFEEGVQPVFAIPLSVDAESIRVRTAGGADFEVPESMVARLRDPPKLEVTDFQVVDTDTDHVTVSVGIENAGGHPATVRANLGSTTLSGLERVDFEAPAGETSTYERELNRFGASEDETFRLDWGTGSKTVTVESD